MDQLNPDVAGLLFETTGKMIEVIKLAVADYLSPETDPRDDVHTLDDILFIYQDGLVEGYLNMSSGLEPAGPEDDLPWMKTTIIVIDGLLGTTRWKELDPPERKESEDDYDNDPYWTQDAPGI